MFGMGESQRLSSDGRTQRSERSRSAIVQAMIELIGEGALAPTAQQVAERADVGVRTVFRHFSDMDTLFATMNEQLTARVEPLLVEAVQTGPLEERVDGLVERRLEIFGTIAPYLRSSVTQRWRSEFLRKEHERTIRTLRQDLRRWLPEVESAPAEVADALELLLSFEGLLRLRFDQRLGPRRMGAMLRWAILALLRSEDPAG
jgi:AcrR family transcriptional regulator